MEFIQSTSPAEAAKYIAALISAQLHQKRSVLWLVSGGSSLEVALEASRNLSGLDLSLLTVSLIDERYGAVGHPDSNWQQLLESGFTLPTASLHPILVGAPQDVTAETFEAFLSEKFASSDYCIGLLGIGPDGHTSGILPHSPAVTHSGLVCGYDGGIFRRITTTPEALKHLDLAVVYAVGESKWPILVGLNTQMSIAEQPAQALKLARKLTIFSDRSL